MNDQKKQGNIAIVAVVLIILSIVFGLFSLL